MCLAVVANCETCQTLFCRELELCWEAQARGTVHVTRSAYESAAVSGPGGERVLPVDVVVDGDETYLLKIFPLMEQRRVAVSKCRVCDDMPVEDYLLDRVPGPCTTVHDVCSDCGQEFGIGPLRLCYACHTGMIHVRGDVYDGRSDGKVKVPVILEPWRRVGQHIREETDVHAVLWKLTEAERKPVGRCWPCRQKRDGIVYGQTRWVVRPEAMQVGTGQNARRKEFKEERNREMK